MQPQIGELLLRFKPVLSKRLGVALGLWGEAGIGKSHVAQTLLRQIPCQSFSLHAALPLSSWVRALPGKNLEVWAERILERMGKGEALAPSVAADALGALLAKLAPVVLYLEDLHEADAERLELIRQLAQTAARSKGVGLLVSSRGELPPSIQGVRLNPLSAEESKDLLESQAAGELPLETLEWIFAKTVGNPLFTLEYFRHLTRMGNLWSDGQRWHWRPPQNQGMPVTVEALLERGLDQAISDPLLYEVLGAKVMVPQDADQGLWAKVAGIETRQLQSAVFELARKGLLVGSEFSHPLYKEVLGRKLSAAQRRVFARRAIECLQDDPLNAAHFVADAQLEPGQALELLQNAAQAAKDQKNPVRAGYLLSQATGYAHGEEVGKLAFEAVDLLDSVDFAESIRLATIAWQERPDDPETIFLLAGRYVLAGQTSKAEALVEHLPKDTTSQLEWVKRLIRLRMEKFAEVIQLWQQYPQLHDDPDPSVAHTVGFAYMIMGEQEKADAIAEKALAQGNLSEFDLGRLYSVRGLTHMYLLDLPGARIFLDCAIEHARNSGRQAWLGSTLHNRSILHEQLGNYSEMLADVQATLQMYAETGAHRYFASTQSKLARHLCWIGDYEQAEELLQKSRDLLIRLDASHFLVTCEYLLSLLYQDWQPPHGRALALKFAQNSYATALQLNHAGKKAMALYALSLAQTWDGNPAAGLESANQALELIGVAGNPPDSLSEVLFAKALALEGLKQSEQAQKTLETSLEVARKGGWFYQENRAGLELDRLTGNLQAARQRLSWFKRHGLDGLGNIVLRYFPELAQGSVLVLKPEASSSDLRLEVLGPMQITINGTTAAVRGRKRQELLALLLEAHLGGRSEASRLRLVETLYPAEDELKASAALKEMVRALREGLGEAIIRTTSAGYALGAVASDAENFLKTGQTKLWRGNYLEGLDISNFDSGVADSLYLSLKLKADELLNHESKEAARLGRMLLEFDPYSHPYLELCLQAFRASANYKTAGRVYDQARERMREVGESLPPQWVDFMAARG